MTDRMILKYGESVHTQTGSLLSYLRERLSADDLLVVSQRVHAIQALSRKQGIVEATARLVALFDFETGHDPERKG